MSTFTPDTVTKPKRRSVKKLEKQQGFAFPNGLSSLNIEIRQRAGPIGDLYESLKSLNKMEVLNASELEQEARDLFHELGPRLWPRDSTQAWWLFQQNNDEYPRNLHYDDEEDRTILWGHWLDMVEEKRVNHEDNLNRQSAKSSRQHESASRFSIGTESTEDIRYEEYGPVAYRRSAFPSSGVSQSSSLQSDVAKDNVQVAARTSGRSARSLKRVANELLERMSSSRLPDRNKRPANDLPGTARMSGLSDGSQQSVAGASARAGSENFVSPLTPSNTLGSQVGGPNPSSATSRLQTGQVGTPNPSSSTSRPQAGVSNPLAKVRIFLEVQRPSEPPKKCWSIPVEEMDIFTGERVRSRLVRFKLLNDSEKVLLAHIRPDDGGNSVQDLGVETTFIMPWDCPEQPDWKEMLEGLKAFYSARPTAVDLKLRATLEVGAEGV